MSSYELLELLEYMNPRGAFKTALRGGSWYEDQQIWAGTYNETALLRASYHAVNGGESGAYEPILIDDPSLRVQKAAEAVAANKFRAEVEDDLLAQLGMSRKEG